MVNYVNKSIFIVSFAVSLFSVKAEANKADFTKADFIDEAVVYQNAHYQTSSKEQVAAREDGEKSQGPSIYVGSPGKAERSPVNSIIIKAHRTKVFTPSRSASIIPGHERISLVPENEAPNDQNNEADDSETMSGEDGIFETIGYTREILRREIASPTPMFEEVG